MTELEFIIHFIVILIKYNSFYNYSDKVKITSFSTCCLDLSLYCNLLLLTISMSGEPGCRLRKYNLTAKRGTPINNSPTITPPANDSPISKAWSDESRSVELSVD